MRDTYIVTGAGKGIGRSFAQSVAEAGNNLSLISRTSSDLETLKTELLSINSEIKVSTHSIDLSNHDQTKDAFNSIERIHGQSIKAIVCCAGSWVKSKPMHELETSDFLEGIQSNFFSLFNTVKESLRICSSELKGLSIITFGGTSGEWMNPEAPVMSISKGAVSNYTRILAKQLLPEEVHVAHIIIDGIISNERGFALKPDSREEDYIKIESVVKEIHHIIGQNKDAWTFELDIRPYTRNTKLI